MVIYIVFKIIGRSNEYIFSFFRMNLKFVASISGCFQDPHL